MRSLDQLSDVLHDLSLHPGIQKLLGSNPKVLETFLRSGAWPEMSEETSWATVPDSAEAAEAASLTPMVEEWLETLEPPMVHNLEIALEAIKPGAAEMFRLLLPSRLLR